MAAKDLEVGDLVWAQMRSYPPWPSKIAEPTAKAKVKGVHWVYFFGSKNYAWIPDNRIFPHGKEMLQKAQNYKSAPFRKAVEEFLSESKDLGKQICQEKNSTNSNEIPVKIQNKNKTLKAKKSVLMKKELIEKSRKMDRPSTPPVDRKCVNESLKAKDVKPASNKIGFLGLGGIGEKMVINLLNSGHDVTVWSPVPEKCNMFVVAGDHGNQTPADVIQACDITFCCLTDPNVLETLIFGNCGVLKGLESCTPGKKGYIQLTKMDPQTSQRIANEISTKGGRYLEAEMYGPRGVNGMFLLLAAGDNSLFKTFESYFLAISKNTYFLGLEVGEVSRMCHNLYV